MANVDEVIKDLPTEYQTQIYEKMQAMSEAEQESFLEEVAAAIASSPYPERGAPKARFKEDVLRDETTPNVGEMAPDFELATLDGDARVRLSAHRGKPVGLIFGSYT